MNKTYNIAAFGIPASAVSAVAKLSVGFLPLRYTRHALTEALNDRYGMLAVASFPTAFTFASGWSLVEAEVNSSGALVKFVVRRAVDKTRSLVMVILADGTVKTLWTNLNSDTHVTLDSSKFSRP